MMLRLLKILLFSCAVSIVLSIFFPPHYHGGLNTHRANCRSNLKLIGLGMLQYVQDYDGRYPPTHLASSTGWAEVIWPYIKSTQVFQCPSAPNHATGFFSDYFYNTRLARITQDKIKTPAKTLVSGDGDDDAPLWTNRVGLPPDALTNPDSPARRHMDTANYLFADGHVKHLPPQQVTRNLWLPASSALLSPKKPSKTP